MKCERIRTYSWTGNEVWECKGHTLPAPRGHCWPRPIDWWRYDMGWIGVVEALRAAPLDPTAES